MTSRAQNNMLSAQAERADAEQQTLSVQLTRTSTDLSLREATWNETRAMLDAEAVRLSQEVTRLEHARDVATASEQQLQAELASTCSSMTDQQNSLRDEIKQLKAAVQQAADASATTAAEKEQSDIALADARASLQQQSVSHTALEWQLEELQAQVESARQVNTHAAADNERLKTQLTQAEEYYVTSKCSSEQDIKDLTEQVKQAMERSDASAAEQQKSQQDLEGAQSAAASQQQSLQKELQQVQSALSQQQHKQSQAQEEHEAHIKQLRDSAQQASEDAVSEKSALVAQLSELQEQVESQAEQLRQQHHQELQQQAAQLGQQHEQSMKDLKAEMNDLKVEIRHLKAETTQAVEKAKAEASQAQQQLGEHVSRQEHEDALRDLEDKMEQAVSKAQADGEAAVQAKADMDQSGFHR